MKLGEYIHNFRKITGMTMDEFAKKCHLSKAYISLIEKGYRSNGEPIVPSFRTYDKVAAAIGCSVDELLRYLKDETPVSNPLVSDPRVQVLVTAFETLNEEGRQRLYEYSRYLTLDSRFVDRSVDGFHGFDDVG